MLPEISSLFVQKWNRIKILSPLRLLKLSEIQIRIFSNIAANSTLLSQSQFLSELKYGAIKIPPLFSIKLRPSILSHPSPLPHHHHQIKISRTVKKVIKIFKNNKRYSVRIQSCTTKANSSNDIIKPCSKGKKRYEEKLLNPGKEMEKKEVD